MTTRPGRVVVGYGLFLIICGITGYLLTGETSTSSIVNGIVFGSLMVVMGFLLGHGRPWTLPASASATAIFAVTFAWRGTLQFVALAQGETARLDIAVLLTVMFVVSAGVARILIQRLRK